MHIHIYIYIYIYTYINISLSIHIYTYIYNTYIWLLLAAPGGPPRAARPRATSSPCRTATAGSRRRAPKSQTDRRPSGSRDLAGLFRRPNGSRRISPAHPRTTNQGK